MATMGRTIDPADHIGLASKIAMKFTSERLIEDTETFGDAIVALVKAAATFDESRGFQFSTYAWRIIKREIICGYRRRTKHRMRKHATRVLFVDPEDLQEKLASGSPLEPIDTADLIETMRAHINRLPPQYAKVILGRLEGKKLHEISDEIGVTRERVRQIQVSATGMLRQMMATEGLIG